MNISSLVTIIGKDLWGDDLKRLKCTLDDLPQENSIQGTKYTKIPPEIYYRKDEFFFMKIESGLNLFGRIPDVACKTGKIRMVFGVLQIVFFTGKGIFHLIRAGLHCRNQDLKNYYYSYSSYEHELMEHGLANVIRGFFEHIEQYGGFLAVLYSTSGDRKEYSVEKILQFDSDEETASDRKKASTQLMITV